MTSDPVATLLLATLVLACSFIVPRVFPGWPLWARALWRILVLVVLTVLVQRSLGSPFKPQFNSQHAGQRAWEQVVEAGWWLVAARGAIGLARLLIVLEHRPRETQIVSDLVAGAIYVATTLAVIDFVFAVSIGGLVATSGVIAIVLGLALQSTLSDVFSGIAVGVERPYKAGDLLWVEGGIEGHVIQVNWRSTHIATVHNNIAIVPNSIIAKARLVNRSLPTTIRGESIEIKLDARVPPEHCLATLNAAMLSCRLPLAIPAPYVSCTHLQGDGATYEIGYSVASSDQLVAARNELAARIHQHLYHAGILLAVAGVATLPPSAIPTPDDMLARSDLFGMIAPPERDLLAERLSEVWLSPGDILIREGDTPQALFIIASGVVRVTIAGHDSPSEVYSLSPGESLGAVGLITGAPYVATATALTAVKVYRLDKEAIADAIKIQPELATRLEDLAKRGQLAMKRDGAAHPETLLEPPDMFLARLRHFIRSLTLVGSGGDDD